MKEQLRQRQAQRVRHPNKGAQLRVGLRALDISNRVVVQAGFLRKLLLGQIQGSAPRPDFISQCAMERLCMWQKVVDEPYSVYILYWSKAS